MHHAVAVETEVHDRNWSFVIGPLSSVITNLSRKTTRAIRDCAIIIRRGGTEKLELSSKNLDSIPPPPKQKKLVLAPPLLC